MTTKEISSRTFTRAGHIRLLNFRNLITEGNVWVLKVSYGKSGNSFLGVPVLLLTTVGRKSGQNRTQPLYYLEDGERVFLVASNAGTERDPAWFLNLQAIPQVIVNFYGSEMKMLGTAASAEEKSELWRSLTALFPKWQMMADVGAQL